MRRRVTASFAGPRPGRVERSRRMTFRGLEKLEIFRLVSSKSENREDMRGNILCLSSGT